MTRFTHAEHHDFAACIDRVFDQRNGARKIVARLGYNGVDLSGPGIDPDQPGTQYDEFAKVSIGFRGLSSRKIPAVVILPRLSPGLHNLVKLQQSYRNFP